MNLDLPTVLNLVTTVVLIVALLFTGLQVREANRARRDQASVAVIQATQSERWTHSRYVLSKLPEHAGVDDILQSSPDAPTALFEFGVRLETIGYMVYHKMVPLDMVDDLIGGVTMMFWSRAKLWVEEERKRTGNVKFLEWCQWVAMQIAERRAKGIHRPAYLRDRGWRE